jgi:hypothetical protein
LQNSYFAFGLTIEVNDAENDVYFTQTGMFTVSKTSLHDEIDIKTLSIDGQDINLTFYGDISDWINTENITTGTLVGLYEDFDWEYFETNKQTPFPYYAIQYTNWTTYYYSPPSVGYDVFLVYYDNKSAFPMFWNGSTFISDETDAMSIGYVTQKSIVTTVPLGGFEILDNTTYVAQSIFIETFGFLEMDIYTDLAPEKFNPFRKSESKIPSYNIPIFIISILGITIILMKLQIKKTKP